MGRKSCLIFTAILHNEETVYGIILAIILEVLYNITDRWLMDQNVLGVDTPQENLANRFHYSANKNTGLGRSLKFYALIGKFALIGAN